MLCHLCLIILITSIISVMTEGYVVRQLLQDSYPNFISLIWDREEPSWTVFNLISKNLLLQETRFYFNTIQESCEILFN